MNYILNLDQLFYTQDREYKKKFKRRLKSLKKSGFIYKKRFFELLLSKNLVHTYCGHSIGKKDKKKVLEQYEYIINFFNNFYNNNWSIEIRPHMTYVSNTSYIKYNIYFVVLYPEVPITNRNNSTHLIKDLLVSHQLRIDVSNYSQPNLSFESIEGTRLTQSLAEWASNYRHSHLYALYRAPIEDLSLFSPFCTGTFEELINEMNYNMTHCGISSEEMLEKYFIVVDNFIRYESIEGTPYIRFSRVSSNNYTRNNSGNVDLENLSSRSIALDCNSVISSLLHYKYYNESPSLGFNYYYNNNKIKLIKDNTLESIIKDYIINQDDIEHKKYLCLHKVDNTYESYVNNDNLIINTDILEQAERVNNSNLTFLFRNVELKAYIEIPEQTEENTISNNDLVIYPRFLKIFIKQYESISNKKLLEILLNKKGE